MFGFSFGPRLPPYSVSHFTPGPVRGGLNTSGTKCQLAAEFGVLTELGAEPVLTLAAREELGNRFQMLCVDTSILLTLSSHLVGVGFWLLAAPGGLD